jgi:hypothetical protein
MLTADANWHISAFEHSRNKLAAGGVPIPPKRQFIFKHPISKPWIGQFGETWSRDALSIEDLAGSSADR